MSSVLELKREPQHSDGDGDDKYLQEYTVKYASNGVYVTVIWADGDWETYVFEDLSVAKEFVADLL